MLAAIDGITGGTIRLATGWCGFRSFSRPPVIIFEKV
ncbi:hypothetical protein fHeYen801_045 [Yersinia phage fHe-Yen8-01]|nr:hypothetical protein fHeYen801_045 [Yersinia phage fHe-Yen8-01]